MNPTSAEAWGRVPSRNRRSPLSISHWRGAAPALPFLARLSSAIPPWSYPAGCHRRFPPGGPTSAAPPGEHPAAGPPARAHPGPSHPACGSPSPSRPRARAAPLGTSAVLTWLCILPGIRASKITGAVHLVVGRGHLEQILRIYVKHYNEHRPHRALGLEAPDPPAGLAVVGEDQQGGVRRRDLLGGLLHDYRQA